MSMAENVLEYQPTVKEKKILEALINPANRMKSAVELCDMIGCSTRTYYRAFEKPEFVNYYNQLSLDIVKNSVMPVIHAFKREAVRGSFQHGKVLLEMAGVYRETVRKEVAGDKDNPLHVKVSRVSDMSDEELQALLESDADESDGDISDKEQD